MPDANGVLQAGDPGYIAPGTGLLNSQVGETNVTPGAPVTGYTPAQASSYGYGAAQAPSYGYVAPPASSGGYTASQGLAGGYTPTAYEVPRSATVQEQVRDIVGQDSPLMQQAASIANQRSNDRGLLNSSLGTGAAQQAVIAQALPMAQQTAKAYEQAATNTANQQNTAAQFGAQAANVAALQNAAQLNAASQFGAQAGNVAALTNAGQANAASQFGAQASNVAALNNAVQANTASQFGAQAGNVAALNNAMQANDAFKSSLASATQLATTKMSTQTQLALGNLDVNTKIALLTTESNYKQLLQANASASNAYVQAATNITNVAMNKDMGKEAKDAAITSQMNLLNEQMRTISAIASTSSNAVTALNLSQYFVQVGNNVRYAGANGQSFPTQEAANQSYVQQGVAQVEARLAAEQAAAYAASQGG